MVFPCFGEKILVVGGGKAAALKIKGLLKTDAKIVIVSPDLSSYLRHLARRGKIEHKQRAFRASDVNGAFLVFAATGNVKLQERVRLVCQKRNVLVNIVDQPILSDFFAVATIQSGELVVAISSSGNSPAICSFLKKRWSNDIKAASSYLKELKKYRLRIKKTVGSSTKRKQLLKSMVNDELFFLYLKGKEKEARKRLESLVEEELKKYC